MRLSIYLYVLFFDFKSQYIWRENYWFPVYPVYEKYSTFVFNRTFFLNRHKELLRKECLIIIFCYGGRSTLHEFTTHMTS